MSAWEFGVLTALAEPNRLRIVELLRQGPLPVGQIAEQLALLQPHASRHLRILSDAGVVQAERRAQSRIYHLLPKPFLSLEAWLKTFGEVWEERTDRLDTYLSEIETEDGTSE